MQTKEEIVSEIISLVTQLADAQEAEQTDQTVEMLTIRECTEVMIDNCKRECSEKVKAWCHAIAVEQSQIRKLEREYDAALLKEQKKMVSAILFSSHFTADEISDVVHAVELLFSWAAVWSRSSPQRKHADGNPISFRTAISEAVQSAADCITALIRPILPIYTSWRDGNEEAGFTCARTGKANTDGMGADSAP